MKTTERIKFRRYCTVFFFFSFVGAVYAVDVDLSPRPKPFSTVRVVMEVQGTLDLSPSNGNEKNESLAAKTLPMQGLAELAYDEQTNKWNGQVQSLRHYREANAKIEVSQKGHERSLRDSLRSIGCKLDHAKPLLYSPNGALDRNELELISVPFNTLFIDQLLPTGKVKLKSEWTHKSELIAILLGIDVVTAGDVKSRIVAIEKGVVRIEMEGSVVGSADGIVTDIDVEAKYNFDRKARRIKWLAAKLKERRAIGAATPGFDVLARVRMVIEQPSSSKQETTDLKGDQTPSQASASLLEHRAQDNRFSFLHDRRWHIINESPNSSILRMIDDGETIAQCNIRTMKLDPKKETTLKHFKTEILKGLKNAQPQIADATTLTNSTGLRILRVQVLGTVSESPVQWIYYHAANQQGLGLSYSFTMSAEAAEKFQATDHDITNSLRISNSALQSSVRSAVTR